jgi:hypothetical protein
MDDGHLASNEEQYEKLKVFYASKSKDVEAPRQPRREEMPSDSTAASHRAGFCQLASPRVPFKLKTFKKDFKKIHTTQTYSNRNPKWTMAMKR